MPKDMSYRHVFLLVSATACWGCGTVLSKQVLDRGVAPLTLLAIELLASSLLLAAGVVVFRAPLRWSPSLGRLALLGVLNPGLAYALGLLGLVNISASLSVLLWATEPVLIMLLAVLILRERLAAATVTAVAVALVGVLLVVYRPGATGDVAGISLTMGAVLACAIYTVLTRWLLLDDGSLQVVLGQQVAALIFAVAAAATSWALGLSVLDFPTDGATWALAASSGAIYYGLAFWFYVGGLRGVPASTAGTLLPLIPVFGLAAGYLVGDRLLERQWLGAALVVIATASAAAYHLTRKPAEHEPS
ncbi:DMT family transporter [Nocardioides sp. GCM10028917]|uniref:DMT family transporter n=1 Tax=Nocardioides sp. GCM10028917 TaxID=3273408 RepID=UPI003613D231